MQFKIEKIIIFIANLVGSITEPTNFQLIYSHLSTAFFKLIEQFPQMDIVLLSMQKLFSKEILADYMICFIFCLNCFSSSDTRYWKEYNEYKRQVQELDDEQKR